MFQVLCQRGQTVFDVVNSIIEEFSLKNPKLYLAGSLAAVNPEVDALLLDDNILIIEELGHFISGEYVIRMIFHCSLTTVFGIKKICLQFVEAGNTRFLYVG